MLAMLEGKQRFLEQGVTAINPFAKFPGPPGNYYAQLARITASPDPKSGCLVIRFAFIIIANVENDSTEFGAYPVRIQFYLRESAKSSEQDAWDRLYTQGYQALGCVTASWKDIVDEHGKKVPILITMQNETDRLIKEKPCVILDIKQNPNDERYQNINIRDVLKPDALNHFTKPVMELDDDALNHDEQEQIPEEDVALPDFTESVQAAKDMLAPLDVVMCIEQGKASQLDIDWERLATEPLAIVRKTILSVYIEKAGYVPTDYDLSFPDEVTFEGKDLVVTDLPDATEAELDVANNSALMEEILEEELEDVLEEAVNDAGKLVAIMDEVTALDRKGRMLAIRELDPELKFYKTTTDEDLHKWLFELRCKDQKVPFEV